MVLKITNLHILRYLPTYWLYLLERYTIDNQRCTHTASALAAGLAIVQTFLGFDYESPSFFRGGLFDGRRCHKR